jgi:hypothetical protein
MNRAAFLSLIRSNMLAIADSLALSAHSLTNRAMAADVLADAETIRAEFGAANWHSEQLAKWEMHAPVTAPFQLTAPDAPRLTRAARAA